MGGTGLRADTHGDQISVVIKLWVNLLALLDGRVTLDNLIDTLLDYSHESHHVAFSTALVVQDAGVPAINQVVNIFN